ncbi:unnamed protein product [marine sediment metagenome]|uniref:Uncharacterized protein n=1 Tax=marine sediment metagenome TaxID=412755 RepID=X1A3U6_9ZZZZ
MEKKKRKKFIGRGFIKIPLEVYEDNDNYIFTIIRGSHGTKGELSYTFPLPNPK